ncbi:ankyrin repeat domain-containing protein 26-like isoform X2 [Microtus oregoni]|uniref:ankyrin repeat domain-containing protein 26-like isoform X2 n=1 Tax=Microtus oregoni TaxID=111838 RepID=UPI001BB1F6FB|nr:ankyrin repeat domain-containing protein 26-like isoform X2 [Microtus oregoni]
MEPKSHPMLLTKKQMKQEVDRLTMELQLINSQRNELLDRPTFISEDTMENRSPLHYVSAHNHPNVVTLLSSNDYTDINMKDDEGCTPLIKAAQRDNVECISILLMHGADPHIIDANGDAALHHAICRGNLRVVSKLLEYNVDIKAKTEYGLTPYKLALFENQLKMAEFLIENGADAPSELTPNSGGATAVESEQAMKTCANSNKEKNFSTDIKPSCSGIRPPGELKPILKKSLQISGDNGRNQDQIPLRLSENPHVTTEDTATTSAIKEDIDNFSSRYTIIEKQILYSKKIAATKKQDQAGLSKSKSMIDLSTLGEALPEFSKKKSRLMVETKKGEDFLPPPNMHDIVPQPPAHADATSTSHVSETGDNRQSSEETTVNTTSVSERGDNRQSSEETTVNTSVSERGDNLQSSEETTVNNTSVDHTPSLGDTLDPQNAHMRVLASSPAHGTSYAANTPVKVFPIWAATTSLLLLTSSMWLLQLVALTMPWVWNLI